MKNETDPNVKRLGNGTANDFGWVITKLSWYLFAGLSIGSAIALALLYVYLWWEYGFFGLLGFFTLLIFSRWGVAQLVQRPKWFEMRPRLLASLRVVDQFFGWLHRKMGFLHAMHARGIKLIGKTFIALPGKVKFGITLAALVIFVPLSLYVTWNTVEVVRAKLPYGKSRYLMTPEELAARKVNRVNMAKFAVWGKQDADKSAGCMEKYQTLLYAEAQKQGLTPQRVEGQLFVEAFCDADIVNSKSGAAGMAQLMLTVGCERNLVMDKAFCGKVFAAARTESKKDDIYLIPKNSGIEDRRLNPDYAIPVAADIMGDSARYWGNENWAYVEYHMGMGNLKKLVMYYLDETTPGWRKTYPANFNHISDPDRSIAKAVQIAGITYDDIFFRSTPDRTPKTFQLLFNLADSSATYVYTGLAATEGFALMRSDKKAFLAMIKEQQDPDGGIANRPMRAWWGNAGAKYQTRADIAAATQSGELVPVKSRSDLGFILRTSGADRIGECDAGYESSYYYTRKATAGLMFLFFSRVKEYGGDDAEVTGLIRTNEMYDKPLRKNGAGCLPQTQPRTHVIGVAFDIGARIKGAPMSKKTRDAVEFVLMDMRADGLIDRIKEGTADHIVYNPAREAELEEVYDRVMGGASPLPTTSPF